jgi:hypothetical protein
MKLIYYLLTLPLFSACARGNKFLISLYLNSGFFSLKTKLINRVASINISSDLIESIKCWYHFDILTAHEKITWDYETDYDYTLFELLAETRQTVWIKRLWTGYDAEYDLGFFHLVKNNDLVLLHFLITTSDFYPCVKICETYASILDNYQVLKYTEQYKTRRNISGELAHTLTDDVLGIYCLILLMKEGYLVKSRSKIFSDDLMKAESENFRTKIDKFIDVLMKISDDLCQIILLRKNKLMLNHFDQKLICLKYLEIRKKYMRRSS